MRQGGARSARDDRRKGEPLAARVAELLLQNAGNRELAHPDMDLRKRPIEGRRRDGRRALELRDLAVVLPFPQRLDEIDRRPPLPARARLDEPLEVAMRDVRRLEADHLQATQLCELLPETGPQARWLDDDARDVADFVHHLRLIAEIGDQHDVAGADHQQRARAGESREVPDVGEAGQEQPVQVSRDEAVHEGGDATTPGVAHAERPFSAATSPRSASSYPWTPSPTTPPSAAGASMECRRSGSRA